MLNVITINGNKYVSLAEFHDFIIGDNAHYSRWVKWYVTGENTKMPVKGYDYLELDGLGMKRKQVGPGRQRKDYLISLDFLKQLCFDIKTNRCREVRHWANSLHS